MRYILATTALAACVVAAPPPAPTSAAATSAVSSSIPTSLIPQDETSASTEPFPPETILSLLNFMATATNDATTTTTPRPSISSIDSAAHSTTYSLKDKTITTMEPECTPASEEYKEKVLSLHNADREHFQAKPLEWDDDLSCIAQRQCAACQPRAPMPYVNGGGYGSNWSLLRFGGGGDYKGDDSGKDVAHEFERVYGTLGGEGYRGWMVQFGPYKGHFGEADPGIDDVAGDFTQIVWQSTTAVGCATTDCKGHSLTFCNYLEPGNVAGEYDTNVLPPRMCNDLNEEALEALSEYCGVP